MTESMGNQTVVFVSVAENPAVRDRYNNPGTIRTTTPVSGCQFRPDTVSEDIDLGDRTLERWRLTSPPVPVALAAKATDEVQVDGVTYQIIGRVEPFADFEGQINHVTVFCERRVT